MCTLHNIIFQHFHVFGIHMVERLASTWYICRWYRFFFWRCHSSPALPLPPFGMCTGGLWQRIVCLIYRSQFFSLETAHEFGVAKASVFILHFAIFISCFITPYAITRSAWAHSFVFSHAHFQFYTVSDNVCTLNFTLMPLFSLLHSGLWVHIFFIFFYNRERAHAPVFVFSFRFVHQIVFCTWASSNVIQSDSIIIHFIFFFVIEFVSSSRWLKSI